MNKHIVCLCLTATCTIGCASLGRRTEAEAHFFTTSQAVAATSLKPALAKSMSSPPIPSANDGLAAAEVSQVAHPAASAPWNGETTPTASLAQEETVAVTRAVAATPTRNGLEDALHRRLRQALRVVVDTEKVVSESVVATLGAAALFVKNVQFAHDQGGIRQTDQVVQPDISHGIWYWLAWIGGAVFTSILAPLLVDLIKLRMGVARYQLDSNGSPASRRVDPGGTPSGGHEARRSLI